MRECSTLDTITRGDDTHVNITKRGFVVHTVAFVFDVLLNASAFEENAIRRGVVVGDGDSPRIC